MCSWWTLWHLCSHLNHCACTVHVRTRPCIPTHPSSPQFYSNCASFQWRDCSSCNCSHTFQKLLAGTLVVVLAWNQITDHYGQRSLFASTIPGAPTVLAAYSPHSTSLTPYMPELGRLLQNWGESKGGEIIIMWIVHGNPRLTIIIIIQRAHTTGAKLTKWMFLSTVTCIQDGLSNTLKLN